MKVISFTKPVLKSGTVLSLLLAVFKSEFLHHSTWLRKTKKKIKFLADSYVWNVKMPAGLFGCSLSLFLFLFSFTLFAPPPALPSLLLLYTLSFFSFFHATLSNSAGPRTYNWLRKNGNKIIWCKKILKIYKI